jgi:hypothetical protein
MVKEYEIEPDANAKTGQMRLWAMKRETWRAD